MKTLLTACLISLSVWGWSQTEITITQGAGYVNDVFYSLDNGVVASVAGDDWDLAFDVTSPFSPTIRLNDGHGRQLSVYPNGDVNAWNDVDTAGYAGWPKLTNGIDAWENGAMNANASSDPSDFSWGIYAGPPTHQVVGDSIYLLERPDASVLKLRIDNLDNGTWNFTMAALDGSGETVQSIDMGDYAGKNFVYFDYANGVIDREPLSTDWDFVFTRYVGLTEYGLFPTTGVLLNRNRPAAEVTETPIAEAELASAALNTDDISTIGNDWKALVDFQWEVVEDLSYFVESASGQVYHLWFTAFEGSSTGVLVLNAAPVSTASVSAVEEQTLSVYPNPTDAVLQIEGSAEWSAIRVLDAHGRIVEDQIATGATNRLTLNTGHWDAGVYLVQWTGPAGTATRRVLKR